MGGSGVRKNYPFKYFKWYVKARFGKSINDGIDIYGNPDKIKGTIRFIPQDDFLVEELTVFENLYFNARFCFSGLDSIGIISAVDKLLKDLDLTVS